MIGVIKLHHVSFTITDLEASKHFFGQVLGLPEIPRPAFRFSGAWYALGDRQLHLIQVEAGKSAATGRIGRSDHMALEVGDIEAVKKRLVDSGVAFTEGGNRDLRMEQIFCRDPDGHVVEFVRYLAPPGT